MAGPTPGDVVVSVVDSGDGGTLTLVLQTNGPTKSGGIGRCWKLTESGTTGPNSVGACGGWPSASVAFAAIVLSLDCRAATEVSIGPDDTRLPTVDGLALVPRSLAEGMSTVTAACVAADGTVGTPVVVPVTA